MERILFLCSYQSLYAGNFIPSLTELEDHLKLAGNECIYLFPDQAKERYWLNMMLEDGRKILSTDFSKSINQFIKELNHIVRENGITIVYSHFYSQKAMELFQLLNNNVRVFIHVHSDFSAGKGSIREKIKNGLIYRIFAGKTRFISVSKDFVKYNPKKITYVPNGIASNRMIEHTLAIEDVKNEYGLSENDFICEIFGWSPLVKGVDIAVEAVKKVYARGYNNIKLLIIHGGGENKIKEFICKHTTCSGDETYIKYLEPVSDVFAYHQICDLLISSSRSEGFSYTILEMLSVGKKCVVSDIPGVHWAKQFKSVTSFTSENVEELACCLEKCMLEEKSVDCETIDRIHQMYSVDVWVQSVCDILERKGY